MDIKKLYTLYQQHPCITTDSRDCPENSIFLALKGDSFNGNLFAVQALEKGCAYAIIDEPSVLEQTDLPDDLRKRLILVDDCLQTFKDLAREHRRQFEIPMVGITGTNGKTTTKELIRAVLSECYQVMATEGNFNNDVGVPKTLFRLTEAHDIAVVEMGASQDAGRNCRAHLRTHHQRRTGSPAGLRLLRGCLQDEGRVVRLPDGSRPSAVRQS